MKVLELPCVEFFGDWEHMEECLRNLGKPLFSVKGDLNLEETDIEYLDNLVSVGGNLYLIGAQFESLGNLKYVGGDLDLRNTPLSEKYSEEEIRQQVEVGGKIYL